MLAGKSASRFAAVSDKIDILGVPVCRVSGVWKTRAPSTRLIPFLGARPEREHPKVDSLSVIFHAVCYSYLALFAERAAGEGSLT